jgi:4-amino-4-deoxy-L-arabinose transferase-like glycosyltransferase
MGRLEWLFIAVLIVMAFALRLWPLSKDHFWDETVYLQNAQVICCGKLNYSELDSRPPLLSLIFAAVFFFWNHVYGAAIVAALLNACGPALLYLSGRMIIGRPGSAIAAVLLAFLPFFVTEGHTLLSDSPALTFILLAFWLLLRALEKPTTQRFGFAGLALAFAVLTRFASGPSVGVLGLLTLRAERRLKALMVCCAGFLIGITPYLVWSRIRWGGFFVIVRNGWRNFRGPAPPFLYYGAHFPHIFSWVTCAGLMLWVAQWLWSRRAGLVAPPGSSGPSSAQQNLMEAYLWFWAAVLFVFFSALHHKELRYAVPLAPPVLLLAGSGISALISGRRKAVRLAAILVLGCALVYTLLPSFRQLEDPFIDDEVSEEVKVSDFLTHTAQPGTVLYTNFNYPVYAFYTNFPVRRLPEGGPALYDMLNRLPANGILIAYKESEDIAAPRLDWLDSNPHFRRFREFPSLVLYQYRPSTAP